MRYGLLMVHSFTTVTGLGMGYAAGEVDSFLQRYEDTLSGRDGLTADDARKARFTGRRTGRRYERREVDEWLDRQIVPALSEGRSGTAGEAAAAPGGDGSGPSTLAGLPPEKDPNSVRFSPVRFGQGYSTEDVDAFLDRVVATLNGQDDLTVTDVQGVHFSPTHFAEGYSMDEVDQYLDDVVVPLIARTGFTGRP